MLYHQRTPDQLANTFVEAALENAPHVTTSFQLLEKLPRFEIATVETEMLRLFNERGDFASAAEYRLGTGEWCLRAAQYFGLSWSPEALEDTIVPALMEILSEPPIVSPLYRTTLENQRMRTIEVVSHLAPALDSFQAEQAFDLMYEQVLGAERIDIRALLNLAQFSDSIAGRKDSTELLPIFQAAAEAIEILKETLSEPAGIRSQTGLVHADYAQRAAVALTVLSSSASTWVEDEKVMRFIEQSVSDCQWLMTVLSSEARLDRMEFNVGSRCKEAMVLLRTTLACLSAADDDLRDLIKGYGIPSSEKYDPFGSLVLKQATDRVSQDERSRIEGYIENTMQRLAPGSSCGPGPEGLAVVAATWGLDMIDSGMVRDAARGRSNPPVHSFLYRAMMREI